MVYGLNPFTLFDLIPLTNIVSNNLDGKRGIELYVSQSSKWKRCKVFKLGDWV